ncbi:ethylene-responsive transcription factor LEP-like [Salvia hispanica]|uniref:ethylene-responsive transcription factor LEP-like n=1 Tax=Salvia hispanica TaxID=49212 RepID=UPI002009459A|nr:ethylene-responsive transcription factor LEP-like [Salvia hispanica]XP_047953324.1 ethylene-responsive transcription factor LEP-like [Salvia hispanica]
MSRSNDQFRYKGVDLEKRTGKYCARIFDAEEKTTKRNNLGTFDTAEEAAMAYDYAARSMHGSNAYTNFVYPDGRHRGSLTNITAPHEPEYELSPDHPAPAAAGYNYAGGSGYNSGYQQSYYGQGEGQYSGQVDYQQNTGFGQVEYPQWVPGDELPPLPQVLTSSAVGYGGGYMPPPGAGSSYSGGGGYGYGNGWQ